MNSFTTILLGALALGLLPIAFQLGRWRGQEEEARENADTMHAMANALMETGLYVRDLEKRLGIPAIEERVGEVDPDEIDWGWIGLPGGRT